jgi:hypothetical protein
MRRYPQYATVGYTFGPGPITPAVKGLIWANIAVYVLTWVFPSLMLWLGLIPAAVFERR